MIVVEGVVRVDAEPATIAAMKKDEPPGLLTTGQTLDAGSIALYADTRKHIESIQASDIEAKLSWRNGMLVFAGESLQEAAAEIERYKDIEFDFADESTRQKPVGGGYRTDDDIEDLLMSMQGNMNVAYEWIGDNKILLSSQ